MLTERKKLAISGALALAMGLVVGSVATGDKPTRDATHEAIGSALAAGSAVGSAKAVDPGAYHTAMRELRDEDPNAIDLLTAPVEPGATVTAHVTIEAGKHVASAVEFVGPDAASFESLGVAHTATDGGVRVEVMARNNGAAAARMIALVRLEP